MTTTSRLAGLLPVLATLACASPGVPAAPGPAQIQPCSDTAAAGPDAVLHPPRVLAEAVPPSDPRPKAGQYQLSLLILPNGLVDTAQVVVTPPFTAEFDRAMRRNLVQWRFRPALRGGCAVPGRTTFTLEFS